MATIKAYTDLEQSKKLAEILPLESADMYWYLATKGDPVARFNGGYDKYGDFELPCWSLAALLDILTENKICHYDDSYYCQYMGEGDEFPIYSTAEYDNPVDVCVEMIEKLHELKML